MANICHSLIYHKNILAKSLQKQENIYRKLGTLSEKEFKIKEQKPTPSLDMKYKTTNNVCNKI